MARALIVFGTLHLLQGSEKAFRNIDDPLYAVLVRHLIENFGIEFVFEEATGMGPTTAERLTGEILGRDRYMDVDPVREDREGFGIPASSNEPYLVGSPPDCAFANWQLLASHEGREKRWLQRIQGVTFDKALMICGNAHMLSFAFRSKDAGLDVTAIDYFPLEKLASRLNT